MNNICREKSLRIHNELFCCQAECFNWLNCQESQLKSVCCVTLLFQFSSVLSARQRQKVKTLISPPDGDWSLVTWWHHGAFGVVGEPGLAAAQRLSVPSGDPRGFARPAALPVLPCGSKQHRGNRQVCSCVINKTAHVIKLFILCYHRINNDLILSDIVYNAVLADTG